jgi:hypothetical protein
MKGFNVNVFEFMAISCVALLFIVAVSWFVFKRISISRIDKRMADDGLDRVCSTDIMGLRVIMIATAISIPVGNPFNHEYNPLIDVNAVRPYGTKFDRIVGLILFLSFTLFTVVAVVGSFFIPES